MCSPRSLCPPAAGAGRYCQLTLAPLLTSPLLLVAQGCPSCCCSLGCCCRLSNHPLGQPSAEGMQLYCRHLLPLRLPTAAVAAAAPAAPRGVGAGRLEPAGPRGSSSQAGSDKRPAPASLGGAGGCGTAAVATPPQPARSCAPGSACQRHGGRGDTASSCGPCLRSPTRTGGRRRFYQGRECGAASAGCCCCCCCCCFATRPRCLHRHAQQRAFQSRGLPLPGCASHTSRVASQQRSRPGTLALSRLPITARVHGNVPKQRPSRLQRGS